MHAVGGNGLAPWEFRLLNCARPCRMGATNNQQEDTMNLREYFAEEPKGAKVEMAEFLGITPNYLSMLIHGKRQEIGRAHV